MEADYRLASLMIEISSCGTFEMRLMKRQWGTIPWEKGMMESCHY